MKTSFVARLLATLPAVWLLAISVLRAAGEDFHLHTFQRQQLTDVYYSEGIGVGDLNRDGHADIVYGPYWFAGPGFQDKREIYPAKAQPRERYADNFFSWVYDFNADGWSDVYVVGFPGTPAYVYENPRGEGHDRPWPKHQVFNSVANESPHFTNLVGDPRPELVCTNNGYFGYATIDADRPFGSWTFHAISEKVAPLGFGHGLGVGDVSGDGRLDVLMKDGWFEQPESLSGDVRWTFHKAGFAPSGGAEMYAYDVDGDGDQDVITSLAAHDFGLAWHEQILVGQQRSFRRHMIMGDQPQHNRYGLVFSELHSVNLADIDGDGLKDIVTGKTYWSHHMQSPMWDAGAVVYWFRLVRTPKGVDWVPHKADGEAGIGRQLTVHDVNQDGLPDLLAGGMRGAHLLLHRREAVDAERWKESQPKAFVAAAKVEVRGPRSILDEKTGKVAGAIEGESMTVVRATAGKTTTQKMAAFKAGQWSGQEQLFWSGAKPGDRLELSLDVPQAGRFDVTAAFTLARDYGIVQLHLDDEPLAKPLDLYNYPDVIASGESNLGSRQLTAGPHRLTIEIKGANASAAKAYLVGLDDLRLVPIAAAGAPGDTPGKPLATLDRVMDLNVGESQLVELSSGQRVNVKLVDLHETRDPIRNAVREARVKVEVDGRSVELVSAMYNLPTTTGGVQIDCSITKGFNSNGSPEFWALDKDARLRLWPAGSPLIQPGTFGYPVKQRWFAGLTQMANEPVYVDGGERPDSKKIYYHSGLDIGGSEGMVEVIAATDGLVVSSGLDVMPEHRRDTPVSPRYDVVYLLDARGWYYRYSHMHTIDETVKPDRFLKLGDKIGLLGKEGGSGGWSHLHFEIKCRQPSGRWGTHDGYAFLWEAYQRQYKPAVIAVSRPHHFIWAGEQVQLDGRKSWSASGALTHERRFNDGTTARGATISRTYSQPGSYSEILKVTDAEGRSAYDFAVVQVLDREHPDRLTPSIHPNYFPTSGIRPDEPVTFKVRTFRTTDGSEVWDFGDGTPTVEVHSDGNVRQLDPNGYAVTTHQYAKPGHYLVRVERSNRFGMKAVGHLNVLIEAPK